MDNYYEDITIERDINYANIEKALKIVKEFVMSNELILYGGMAIDAALKMKGHDGIYHDKKQPDYDFLSSDPISHSSKLGKLICEAGLPNVSIINGIHVTTRRVRVDFISVADISFCPATVLNKIPTIKKNRLLYVHPTFQIIDIHRSLSFPFESPTMPTIFHRWGRDMKRFDMLYPLYPIQPTNTNVKMYTPTLNKKMLKDHCLTGWAAMSYWMTGSLDKLKIPVGEPISILSDNFMEFVAGNSSVTYFSSLFGKIPRSLDVEIEGVIYNVIDNEGDRAAAEHIGDGIYVSNMQYVMMFILTKKFIDPRMSDSNRAYCNDAYVKCVEMVSTKFPPTISYYGYASWSDAYIINRRNASAHHADIVMKNDPNPPAVFPKMPGCDSYTSFDYKSSILFRMDGEPVEKFLPKTIVNFGQADVISDSYEKIKKSRYVINDTLGGGNEHITPHSMSENLLEF